MASSPKECNTKAIFAGLGRLVFPSNSENGYDSGKLREAFCSAPDLQNKDEAARKQLFNNWRAVERPLGGKGRRDLVAPIALHIAKSAGADGSLLAALGGASTMSEVHSVICAALEGRASRSSPHKPEGNAFAFLPSHLLTYNRHQALRKLAGTWVILRPSTQCAASQELLHVLDNGGVGLAPALCLSDMGNLFEGCFALAKDPVAYGTFCREVEGDSSFNMRSIYLSISADGQSDVATGYMLGKKDYSPTILASAPMLLARYTRVGAQTIAEATQILEGMRGKVGLLDIANGHGALEYFGAARSFADNLRLQAHAASQRSSEVELEASNCPLIAPFMPDHGDMLALLKGLKVRRDLKLAEELLSKPVESPSQMV